MKNTKALLPCFILVLFSCKENKVPNDLPLKQQEKTITTKVKNNLPYTSDNVKQHYKFDVDSVNFTVNKNNLKESYFLQEEVKIPLKENDFDIQPPLKNKYFVVETFNFSDSLINKLIIYNTFGDNDTKIFNVQLNSYFNNHLVDKLLLDCRFTFETEYYRDFKIDENRNIQIVKYSIDNLEYNEAGDIIGEKENPIPKIEKVNYKIGSDGKFVKD